MNFLYNFGSAVLMTQFAQKQLRAMHMLIDRKNIAVDKTDDFFQQAITLDRLVGGSDFAQRYRRVSAVRKAMITIAVVILVAALAIFLAAKIPAFADQFHMATAWLMADFLTFAYIIGAGAGAILLLLIGTHFYVGSQFNYLSGLGIRNLWLKVVDRWLPELAQDGPLQKLGPEELAELVEEHLGGQPKRGA